MRRNFSHAAFNFSLKSDFNKLFLCFKFDYKWFIFFWNTIFKYIKKIELNKRGFRGSRRKLSNWIWNDPYSFKSSFRFFIGVLNDLNNTGKCNGLAKTAKQVNKANQHAVVKVREFGPLGGMCLCPFYRSASRVRRITDSAQQRTASEEV